jgi:N-acetylneuraminate lyase
MPETPRGVIPAIVTPLTADLKLNEPVLIRLCERLYGAGCDGVYAGGNTGEGTLLAVETRKRLTEVLVANTPPDRHVIVHVGAVPVDGAVRLARHAESVGARAISSIAPPGPYSFDDVAAYYRRLGDASALPLYVYYFPEYAPAVNTYNHLTNLCQLPRVSGCKFTDFDLYTLSRLAREGKVVFNGRDEVLAAGLLMGARGGIGSFYNIAPELFVEIYRRAQAGDWTGARAAQDRVNEWIAIVLEYPLFPAIKQILTWQGYDCGPCAPPRRSLTAAECDRLQSELRRAGFWG